MQHTEGPAVGKKRPILVGAAVGLVTGLLGMALLPVENLLLFHGGILGAICGGATAALLSPGDTEARVLNAVFADLLSSVLFFALVPLLWVGLITTTEGVLSGVGAGLLLLFFGWIYLVFGGAIAVVVGTVSALVAGLTGLLTSVVKDAVGR